MKNSVITIRLDQTLEKILCDVCQKSGKSRSEIVREALKRQLQLYTFNQLRLRAKQLGTKAGVLTDEDVFSLIS